jgi:hypothetical protein
MADELWSGWYTGSSKCEEESPAHRCRAFAFNSKGLNHGPLVWQIVYTHLQPQSFQ